MKRDEIDVADMLRDVATNEGSDYAVVRYSFRGEILMAVFALPPDSEPTGRLWAKLEKDIELKCRNLLRRFET